MADTSVGRNTDFDLLVGIDVNISSVQMQDDITKIVESLNNKPHRIKIGLDIDREAIESFKTEIANIHKSMSGLGGVTVGSVGVSNTNSVANDISRLTQNTQGAITSIRGMRAELNSVNTEKVRNAISGIDGMSESSARVISQAISESNVVAKEVDVTTKRIKDNEQKLVQIKVHGSNATGRTVEQLINYSAKTGEILSSVTHVHAVLDDTEKKESARVITVRELNDLYRNMLSLQSKSGVAKDTTAYTDLSTQIEQFSKAIGMVKSEGVSVDDAFAQITNNSMSSASAVNAARNAMSELRVEMEKISPSGATGEKSVYATIASAQKLLSDNSEHKELSTYKDLQTQLKPLQGVMHGVASEGLSLEASLKKAGIGADEVGAAVQKTQTAMAALKAEMSGVAAGQSPISVDSKQYNNAIVKINTLSKQIRANAAKWTAAERGTSSTDYQTYVAQATALEDLRVKLSAGKLTPGQYEEKYSAIKKTVSDSAKAISDAGEATKTWTQRVGGLAKKFTTWFGITRVVMGLYRTIRQMVSSVIELDTAMTELKKVTDETDAAYNAFLDRAVTRAQKLGATLTDTVAATADFARLGYDISDSEKLADAAIVYKNVGDGIDDINTASESVIATMQAFGVSADDVMTIVDRFNEVGNNYAISSAGVGQALLRSAAAMYAANNTLDETIALAAAANTVVQDPEKVGTTLKTVSMYLRAAKTEAEDAGESTDGMASSVSKLRDELLSLTGHKVDIQIDEDTFKSTYQILKELSGVWGNLSDISQANILEMVGGKRNSNVVAALLENFSVAEQALLTSSASAGSALRENDKYLDSIQGKIDVFNAAFAALSSSMINSGLIKFLVSVGTSLLNSLRFLQQISLLLPGITASIVLFVALQRRSKYRESASAIATIASSLITQKGVTDALTASVATLSVAEKEELRTKILNAVTSRELTAEEAQQIVTTLGLTAAQGALTTSNKALGSSFKSLMASIPVWGWIALAVSVATTAISWLIASVQSSEEKLSDLQTEFSELTSQIKSSASEFQNLSKSVNDIIPRFSELAKGVNGLGQNLGGLSDDEYAEFIALNNQLAELFPELNVGLNESGNSILALNYGAEDMVDVLYELLEAQRLLAAEDIAEDLPSLVDNIKQQNDLFSEETFQLKQRIEAYKSAYGIFSSLSSGESDFLSNYDSSFDYNRDLARIDIAISGLREMFEVAGNTQAWTDILEKYYKPDEGFYQDIDWWGLLNGPEIKPAITRLEKEIELSSNRIENAWKRLLPSLLSWTQTDPVYNEMSAPMQNVVNAMVQGLDLSSPDLSKLDATGLQNYITAHIIDPVSSSGAAVKTAFEEIDDLLNGLAVGEDTPEEFATRVQDAFNSLINSIPESEIDSFTTLFITGFNNMGIAGENFADIIANLITAWSKTGTLPSFATSSDLATAIENQKEAYAVLESAQQEMSASGSVSADTIKAMASITTEYLDFLYEENGAIKLNTEAWRKRAAAGMTNNISDIENEIAQLEEERKVIEENLRRAQHEHRPSIDGITGNGEDAEDAVKQYTKEIENNSKAIEENQSKLAIYKALYEDVANSTPSAATGVVGALGGIQQLQSGFEQLDKIYADVFDGEYFDWSAILNNQQFIDTFGGLGDAYSTFIETVASSPNDLSACQSAFNNLTTAYLLNSDALTKVTDETRNTVIVMLEQMGVANAASVVDAQLAYNKERLKYATSEYINMSYDEVVALYEQCAAGTATKQVLAELAASKLQANASAIRTESDVEQLIALATAANATEASLVNVAKAKSLMAQAEKIEESLVVMGPQQHQLPTQKADGTYEWVIDNSTLAAYERAEQLREEAQKLLSTPLAYTPLNASDFKVSYTGGSQTSSAMNSASSGTDTNSASAEQQETWFDKQLALHQHRVAMEKETDSEYLSWLNSAYKQAYNEGIIELDDYYKYQEEVFSGLRDIFRDQLSDIEHEISMREDYGGDTKKILALYKKLISKVEKEISSARASGLGNNDEYIQELQDKWQSYTNSIKTMQDDATESAKDAISELVDYRLDMIKQDADNEKDALDKKLDTLREFYDKQKEMLQAEKDEEQYLEDQAEKRRSVSDIRTQILMLKKDDSAWAQKRILELQEELAEAEKELNSFEDDHALELALDALDNAYDAQEAQIEAEMDALEKRLNDPQALYNQALSDIKKNTGDLYKEMIAFNRKYGTGNDEDATSVYEEAYEALKEYKNIYGKDYEGVVLTNSTNYKTDTSSWDDNKVSGNTTSTKSTATSSSTNQKASSQSTSSASLSKGSTVTVKKTATHFAANSSGLKMASSVPGNSFVVYDIDGTQVLIGKNGAYTGWIKKSDIVGYASGTRNATEGLHEIDELGSEYLFSSRDGNNYRVLNSGDKVLNAKATDFLYKFATSGGEILKKILNGAINADMFSKILPASNNNEINMGDIVVTGNADTKTVSEIRREQRDAIAFMLKELNRLNK